MLQNDILQRANSVDPAQIGHYIQSGFMRSDIKPIDDSFRVLGPAFTVRLPTNDNSMLYYAMQFAPAGSILVIDRMGESRFACCGEIVVRAAQTKGIVGIVVDGPSTDTLKIKEIGLPVFSTGRSAVTNTLIGMDGEYNVDISCGGTVVHPWDIIFGDTDGVIVCPENKFEEYLKYAEAANERERKYLEAFQKGEYITKYLDINALVNADIKGYAKKLLRGIK